MKISILKESLCIGGMERSVSNFSLILSKNHEVNTVLFYGDIMAYPYGGTLYDMGLPAKKTLVEKVFNNFRRLWCYKKHIREFKPDVAFQLLTLNSPVGFLKLNNCVKIVSGRDFSSVANNTKLYKKRLDTSDAMICNSNYLKDFFVNMYPEDKNKVFVVSNIIDVKEIKEQSQEEVSESFLRFKKEHKNLVVSVGRFCKEKAFEHMISAFAKTLEYESENGLVLIGDGAYKEKYLKIIDEFGISKSVFFTGFQKNPYKYMAKCDVFVLSSLSEGFPNVLAEAMALSLPVIAVNCFSGPAEILMEDYDYGRVEKTFCECDYGILTPHYDAIGEESAINEISKAVMYFLQHEEIMKKYGKLSGERALAFSPETTVEKLENIFEELLFRRTQNNRTKE